MEYRELKSGITEHLNSAAEDFFMVGYFLRQISEKALFIEDGYKSIWEFAKGEYGLSTSSASRFMAINARFSIDGGEHMAEKYIGMGVSKLQEMLGLPDEELEKVTQETTVREIRAMKAAAKEPLSFFGLPKTVYPEGSLLSTPGCGENGHAKYTCFGCSRACEIRQEPRQCVVSTCGNPKPCGLIDSKEFAWNIQCSLYKDECQMLHHELAPTRDGDGEPSPCCRNCKNKTCFNRCDVAKEEDEAEKKKAQEELRKQQQEAEAKKPDMGEKELKALYRWLKIKATDEITGATLKNKYGKSYTGGNETESGIYFNCTPRGAYTKRCKEMTWAQIAKRLKEIQERELQEQEQEKEAAPTEAEYLTEFYERDLYPSTRILIKNRDKAAVTKLFKEEYGSTYENGTRTNGSSYNCYPDKIVFRSQPGDEGLQITWGRFVTKLIKLLDEHPEIERGALEYDEKHRKAEEAEQEQEPDVIDADFREVSEPVKEAEEIEDQESEEDGELQEQDPEAYDARDVRELLKKHETDLKAYREVEGLPTPLMRKQRILVDALTLFLHEMEQREIEADGGGEDD